MARALAAAFCAPLASATVSRLLIDLNRSIGHPQLFSAATRDLPATLRAQLVARHYQPYREQAERLVSERVSRGRTVIHISSHSFTPELHGKVRQADVGLLYDPARPGETALCERWKAALAALAPELRVRRNYPYAGKGDGLTARLRKRFLPHSYLGIELEINQAIVLAGGRTCKAVRSVLVDTLKIAITQGVY